MATLEAILQQPDHLASLRAAIYVLDRVLGKPEDAPERRRSEAEDLLYELINTPVVVQVAQALQLAIVDTGEDGAGVGAQVKWADAGSRDERQRRQAMRRLGGWMVVWAVMCLTLGPAPLVQAAPSGRGTQATYRDAAYRFSYPRGWTGKTRALALQLRASFVKYVELRITDIGGVEKGSGLRFSAAVLGIRLRVSPDFHPSTVLERPDFPRSFLEGLVPRGAKVVRRGASPLGPHRVRVIEFIRGSGAAALRERIFAYLSMDAWRLYLIYFEAPAHSWQTFGAAFGAIARSMRYAA